MRNAVLSSVASLILWAGLAQATPWPLWEAYVKRFYADGRIVDPERGQATTSEGQAYAMFFALVANDHQRFDELLNWTQKNLAEGDLGARLPAWHWGANKTGQWGPLDNNAASDADLWMAYTLLEAGRLWKRPEYRITGLALANNINDSEVADVPGLGRMLLPGPTGFRKENGAIVLNPSYVPVPVLLGLAKSASEPDWRTIAANVPALLRGAQAGGFVLDWISMREGVFGFSDVPAEPLLASYDAIRVYLWAGMLHPRSAHRSDLLRALRGMPAYLKMHSFPPAEADTTGSIRQPQSSGGFSGCVAVLLGALGEKRAAADNMRRLQAQLDPDSGLYGKPARYYEQNLALFTTGFTEGRYRLDPQGNLMVNWKQI